MGKNESVARDKTGCITPKKHTFEHILGGYDYTETVAEDSRIYDAALTRTF